MVHSGPNEPTTYSVIRLNDWSTEAWAVVDPTGAIAAVDGKLLMRLSREDARERARKLTIAANSRPGDDPPGEPRES